MSDLQIPPTEPEVGDVIATLNRAGLPHLAMVVHRLAFQRDHLCSIVEPLNRLRQDEGNTVLILCDNPDFGGAQSAVEVSADWTEWKRRRFEADNLAGALQAAVIAAEAAGEGKD